MNISFDRTFFTQITGRLAYEKILAIELSESFLRATVNLYSYKEDKFDSKLLLIVQSGLQTSTLITLIQESIFKMVNGKNSKSVRKSGYIFEYRFTFLGDKRTGKTSVMNRFMNDTFTHRYRPTIEDHVTHTIDHNGNICVCLLVDTCGGSDFPAMRRLAISKGNAFLLCYAINNRKSFEEAKRIAEEIISLKDTTEDVKIILIGNKVDLHNERQVERKQGQDLVSDLNTGNVSSQFFEVSAYKNEGIHDIFTSLLNMFIPEQSVVDATPEKSPFSRISLRKKSKRRKSLHKQKNMEIKKAIDNETNYYSDTEVSPNDRPLKSGNSGKLVRSASADILGEDSDSGVETSPNSSPSFTRKESSAKDILRKTFGSMQRLFVKPHEGHEALRRANTADSAIERVKKQSHI